MARPAWPLPITTVSNSSAFNRDLLSIILVRMLLTGLVKCGGTQSSRIELACEQIHKQAVAPSPLRRTPVLAHDADGAEANLLVRADRRHVVGRRVDRKTVMSPLVNQVARERSHRVGSQSAPLGAPGEEDVNSCVTKIGLVLLVVLDQSHKFAFPLDRKPLRLIAPFGLPTQLRLVRRPPPARDAGFGLDLGYPLDIFSPERSKHDVLAAQERGEIDRAARQSSSIYSSPCPPCRRRRRQTPRRRSRCGTLRDPDNVWPDDPGHGREVELL